MRTLEVRKCFTKETVLKLRKKVTFFDSEAIYQYELLWMFIQIIHVHIKYIYPEYLVYWMYINSYAKSWLLRGYTVFSC